MKRISIIILAIFFTSSVGAQNNPVDQLFEKYGDKEGFTVVHISGKMLNMFSENTGDERSNSVLSNTNSIMVLTAEESAVAGKVNFYDELKSKMNFAEYEELMEVKEASQTTKMYVKYGATEETITEFLLISGGTDENTLISIRGNLNLKDLSSFSTTLGISELEQLEGQ